MAKTGGGGLGVNFLASENWSGKYILRFTCPNGECSQNLVSNPALTSKDVNIENSRFIFQRMTSWYRNLSLMSNKSIFYD